MSLRSSLLLSDIALIDEPRIQMTENKTIPQSLIGIVKAVFLLCLAALIPLGVAEWYSGQDAPHETREMYDTLENILVWVIISCIFMWVVVEAWREIRFHLTKSD